MPFYKLQYYLEAGKAGWSETFYINKSTITAAETSATAMARFRANLLGVGGDAQPEITGWRLNDVENPRVNSLTMRTFTSKGEVDGPADMPWTGILTRIKSLSNGARSYLIRGVPDIVVREPFNAVNIDAGWQKDLDAFENALKTLDFRIKQQEPATPQQAISAMTITGLGEVRVASVDHGLVENTMIQLLHVGTTPCLRGRYRVTVLDDDLFVLQGTNLHHISYPGGGHFRKIVPLYSAIDDVTIRRKGSRKVGRPFDLLRGRQSACRH